MEFIVSTNRSPPKNLCRSICSRGSLCVGEEKKAYFEPNLSFLRFLTTHTGSGVLKTALTVVFKAFKMHIFPDEIRVSPLPSSSTMAKFWKWSISTNRGTVHREPTVETSNENQQSRPSMKNNSQKHQENPTVRSIDENHRPSMKSQETINENRQSKPSMKTSQNDQGKSTVKPSPKTQSKPSLKTKSQSRE